MNKEIKGNIEINYGMDNFCYIHTRNGRRVDLTNWMKKFDGKKVLIRVFLEKPKIKVPKSVSFKLKNGRKVKFTSRRSPTKKWKI